MGVTYLWVAMVILCCTMELDPSSAKYCNYGWVSYS